MQELGTNHCEICYCNYKSSHEDSSRPEGICYSCWHQHITTALTQISYKVGSNILSPFEGRDTIDVCQALNSLHEDHAQQLEEWLFKKYAAFTVDIEKCPSEGCDYIFTAEKCVWEHSDQKCPKCEKNLAPSPSLDFKTLIGYIYFLFLTSKCPKCEIPIQKTTGCPHMSCPCGHEFCWYCLKDYFASGNNLYSVHETKQCAFIFFSKMTFIFVCLLGVVLSFLGNEAFQLCIKLFFTGASYVLHALILDLITLINITVINQINNRRWQNYHSSNYLSTNFLIAIIVIIDIVTLGILWYLELLMISAIIMLVTLGLVGIAALSVWLIVFSCETWFDYII